MIVEYILTYVKLFIDLTVSLTYSQNYGLFTGAIMTQVHSFLSEIYSDKHN